MKRLLIDWTRTLQAGLHTGIQRVVRQIARHAVALAAEEPGLTVLPVVLDQGRFVAVPSLPPHPFETAATLSFAQPGPVSCRPGDVLLLADAAWYVDGLAQALPAVREAGCRIVPLMHDLISVRHPQWFNPGVGERFAEWLDAVLPLADLAVTVSDTTASALRDYLQQHQRATLATALPIRVNWPGADGVALNKGLDDAEHIGADVLAAIGTAAAAGQRCVIQVGSIEPRKRHDLVLDACEQAWRAGAALRLVLIGSHGWKTAAFTERLANHPELGQRLFHLRQISDAGLAYAYRMADASIHASAIEGFGLPIAEAGHHRLPVLLSDTPVHREVGGPLATYFPADDATALGTLLTALPTALQAALPSPALRSDWAGAAGHRGWRQSTRELIALLAARPVLLSAA
ncbi:glycosyltransferase family 4 protein [Paracidovorax citrulli]